MKKYIITITLFILSLIFIEDAYALNTKGWGFNINTSSKVYAYNCTSKTSCKESLTVNTVYETDTQDNFIQGVESYVSGIYTVANDDVGFEWIYNVDNHLKKGYLYNLTSYHCNLGGTELYYINMFTGNTVSEVYNRTYPLTYNDNGSGNTISNQPYYNGTANDSFVCYYFSRFIVPSTDSQYIGIQLGTEDTVTTTQYYYGYTLTELGVYDAVTKSDLNSAIKNSGLASADSVEEVETAVADVKDEITVLQEQQEQQHNEMKDTITNSDSSGATNDAGSFFDSFTSEDNGGISSIITAPLNLINGMLDVNVQTCEPLSINILGKDVDLPCGKLLWSRAPNSIVVLWQTIICGFFAYKLIVSLYHDIDKLKDPEQKGVDTLDL